MSTAPAFMSRTSSRERADLVGRPRIDAAEELDRLADVAQGVVDQVRQGVDFGRLGLAGHDQALAAMRRQVARQRGDPAGVRGEPVAGQSRPDGSPTRARRRWPGRSEATSRAAMASR